MKVTSPYFLFVLTLAAIQSTKLAKSQPAWHPIKPIIGHIENGDIFLYDIGTGEKTNISNSSATEMHISFSPDGTKLAYDSDSSGFMEIYTMDLDGGNIKQLTYDQSRSLVPVWAGNGEKIFYNSTKDGNWEIYSINNDGSEKKNISNNPAMDIVRSMTWSGDRILFDSDRGGTRDIYIMNKDGTEVNCLVPWDSNERIAMRAPGDKIAFSSDKHGNEDIFLIDEDGKNVTILIQTPANEFYPNFASFNYNLVTFINDQSGDRLVYLKDLTTQATRQIK